MELLKIGYVFLLLGFVSLIVPNVIMGNLSTTNPLDTGFPVKFYSGRSYGYFVQNVVSSVDYYFCTTQWFASLDTSGHLVTRRSGVVGGYGDSGIDDASLQTDLRDIVNRGLYPVIRIWLNNLDMSDQQWFSTKRTSSCPSVLSQPQPIISQSMLIGFLTNLEHVVDALNISSIIFVPCWEFNQVSTTWTAGESWRYWSVTPLAYDSFMQILVTARNQVAPKVRIGVQFDGAIGQVSLNWNNPDFTTAWNNQGASCFSPWMDGARRCNFSFDALGVSAYPRVESSSSFQNNKQAIGDMLGAKWMKRIADLAGSSRFFIYEWDCYSPSTGLGTGTENFVRNTYAGIIQAKNNSVLDYEGVCWYMQLVGNGQSVCNQLASQYYGWTGISPSPSPSPNPGPSPNSTFPVYPIPVNPSPPNTNPPPSDNSTPVPYPTYPSPSNPNASNSTSIPVTSSVSTVPEATSVSMAFVFLGVACIVIAKRKQVHLK